MATKNTNSITIFANSNGMDAMGICAETGSLVMLARNNPGAARPLRINVGDAQVWNLPVPFDMASASRSADGHAVVWVVGDRLYSLNLVSRQFVELGSLPKSADIVAFQRQADAEIIASQAARHQADSERAAAKKAALADEMAKLEKLEKDGAATADKLAKSAAAVNAGTANPDVARAAAAALSTIRRVS